MRFISDLLLRKIIHLRSFYGASDFFDRPKKIGDINYSPSIISRRCYVSNKNSDKDSITAGVSAKISFTRA